MNRLQKLLRPDPPHEIGIGDGENLIKFTEDNLDGESVYPPLYVPRCMNCGVYSESIVCERCQKESEPSKLPAYSPELLLFVVGVVLLVLLVMVS